MQYPLLHYRSQQGARQERQHQAAMDICLPAITIMVITIIIITIMAIIIIIMVIMILDDENVSENDQKHCVVLEMCET